MTSLPYIDDNRMLATLEELLAIPSPTGHTDPIIAFVEAELREIGLEPERSRKGGLTATLEGETDSDPRALTAHVDTLGAVVKEIKANGRLRLDPIGGLTWNTVEGEGLTIFASAGDAVRGSLLITTASGHAHGKKLASTERSDENMEVRLDALTSTAEETRELGIRVGDIVAFDPRIEIGAAGFVRSRYLDDKAGLAAMMGALRSIRQAELQPAQRTTVHVSVYEEVGHGAAAGLPDDLAELVAVDMAVVGSGQESHEQKVTICTKDSGGPYHAGLTARLRNLAASHEIQYVTDVYPHYGSDGEAYWRAGADVQVALIGPGVDASHNYERTHRDGLLATAKLICAYVLTP